MSVAASDASAIVTASDPLTELLSQSKFDEQDCFAFAEDISRAEVSARIEALVLQMLRVLGCHDAEHAPVLRLVNRQARNVLQQGTSVRLGLQQQLRSLERSPGPFVRLWKVLAFAHQLLAAGKKATQRERKPYLAPMKQARLLMSI